MGAAFRHVVGLFLGSFPETYNGASQASDADVFSAID
jgi:hypothetical protein